MKQDTILTPAFLSLDVIWLILALSSLPPSVGSPSDITNSNLLLQVAPSASKSFVAFSRDSYNGVLP
jgi:hypothetical protein